MEKSKIDGFINRYNLGSEIESVLINATKNELTVRMISDDKSLLGDVTKSNNSGFPEGSFGIYTTSQLKQLLSVLDDDITIKEGTASLIFSDKGTKINYMLADESVIPKVPDLKKLPDFDIEVSLDSDFVNKFVKSKAALSEVESFAFMSKNGKSEIVLGYSTTNTNSISLEVSVTTEGDVDPILFSAKYLRQILLANKSSTQSTMKISTEGLAHVSFDDGEYISNYYLVQIQQ